ncbi:MAG: hypothetical protein IKT34_04420 [Clostridia bacterium]|nr:hypothetical protein [Clostridia bacterium]
MKKFRPIIGISLLIQSITFFILSILNIEKKKPLASAFGILGAIGGAAGTYLLVSDYKERKQALLDEEEFFDEFDELYGDFDDFEISDDDITCAFESEDGEAESCENCDAE